MKLQDKTRTGGRTTVSGIEVLVASGGKRSHTITIPDVPPREWFREPTDVTPKGALTITDEGRIYGYLAPADTLHRSFRNQRVKVPMGRVDYTKWLGGEALVADGRVVAGPITMNCGHASTNPGDWSYTHRTEHYDNTCSVVAKAAIGENRHGVWIAGALEPYVTAEQVSKMLACRLSGDWSPHRKRPGWREFVAALLVPVPGFAMARTAPSTLVASGARMRRTPAQEAKSLAAKEQFFGSQPPSVRRKAGLPPHPEDPGPVMVSAAVPWRYPRTPTASGKPQPFYVTVAEEDRAYREAWDAARRIAHLESGNLPGEALTGAQEGACAAYANLLTAGAVDEAARVMDTLRGSARRLREKRLRDAQDAIARRTRGDAFVLVASAERQKKARYAVIRERVNRRAGGGGSAA